MKSPRQRGWPVPTWLRQASDGADPRKRGEVFLSAGASARRHRASGVDSKYLHGYGLVDRAVPCSRGDAPLSAFCRCRAHAPHSHV
jgi:hypothetical protein